MKNISGTTDSQNEPSSTAGGYLSKAQVIAWCFAFSSQTVLAVVGNLLTIAIFAFNKKLRTKKSLCLVMNMAFDDSLFVGVCFPVRIYSLAAHKRFQLRRSSTIFRVIYTASPQALFITAVLTAAERFNAIYWPLNHQTISMRAVMACYFDGVELNSSSHVSSATPNQQPTGSECFHLFIRFVSSYDYLSAPSTSSSGESFSKKLFLTICVCFIFELLDPCSDGYQFHKHFWIPHVYLHFAPQFVDLSFQFVYQPNSVRTKNS